MVSVQVLQQDISSFFFVFFFFLWVFLFCFFCFFFQEIFYRVDILLIVKIFF